MENQVIKIKKFSEVGRSRPSINAPYHAKGSSWYTGDIKFPGMLFGKILASPYPHAIIKRINTSEAEKLPGVVSVITHKDVPKVRYNSSHNPKAGLQDEYVLADKARFVGDKVAAVAADDKDTAEEALELIDVEYEELPAVLDPIEAMAADAPRVHDGVEKNIAVHLLNEWGDVEKGFQEAYLVFEDEYSTQATHPCPMEPHACISFYASGRLEIWSSTQAPHRFLPKLSKIFSIPQNKIQIHQPFLGGGFGNKCDIYLEPITALLSMKSGAPVMMEFTREEQLSWTFPRHPSIIKLKIGVKKDGTITARQARAVVDAGAYATQTPNVLGSMGHGSNALVSMYRTPNFKFDGHAVYTNKTPSGAFRGFGDPQGNFAVESLMDTIAEELGIDPMELRAKNAIRKGDKDPSKGIKVRSCGLRECAERASQAIAWKEKRAGKAKNKKGRGVGTAWLMHGTGAHPSLDETCSAEVKVCADGKISVVTSTVDMGQGIMTTLAQIAAEELGVSFSDVDVTRSDTTQPVDKGAYASGGVYITGEAVRRAAADAKSQLLKKAAWILEETLDKLEFENGVIRVRGKTKSRLSVEQVMEAVKGGEIIGRSTFTPTSNAPSFGVVCAEVEVDVETGEVSPKKLVCAVDVGKAINPLIVEGQIEGGITQGLGYALTEEMIWDKKVGRLLNRSLLDYKILTARSVPKLVPIIVESKEPTGPFMAKGLGESPVVAIAPAIANAIYNAVGVRIKELPITPEKLLAMIKRRGYGP